MRSFGPSLAIYTHSVVSYIINFFLKHIRTYLFVLYKVRYIEYSCVKNGFDYTKHYFQSVNIDYGRRIQSL
jgi:hypothetical protein